MSRVLVCLSWVALLSAQALAAPPDDSELDAAAAEAAASDPEALAAAVGSVVGVQTKDRVYRFVKLAGLARNAKTSDIRALEVEAVELPPSPAAKPAARKPRKPAKQSLPLAGIERVWRGDELLYVGERFSQSVAEENRFRARARANDVRVWPRETWDEYQVAVADQREQMRNYARQIPGAVTTENDDYLILAQLSAADLETVAQSLAEMHQTLVKLFGYKPGTPIYKGKAMVVIFEKQADYQAFETKLFGDSPGFAEAVCTYVGKHDAEVLVLGCHAGKDRASFAHLYAHETSHGFVWRYRTASHPPAWVKEGMAEVIAERVSRSPDLAIRERDAAGKIRVAGSLGGLLAARSLDFEQYAVASQLIKFMMTKNNAAFLRFLDGIKEGQNWEESLQTNWNATPEELITAWGKSLGIPNLQP